MGSGANNTARCPPRPRRAPRRPESIPPAKEVEYAAAGIPPQQTRKGEIGAADELKIAPFRRDGTPRKPVTIWVVRHGDDLYVRSYRGRGGSWFRGAQVRHEGHIRAGGVDKDVIFAEETDPSLSNQIDAGGWTGGVHL